MSQFYVTVPLMYYIYITITVFTLPHVSALKWPSSAVPIHFVSRVKRIPVQLSISG